MEDPTLAAETLAARMHAIKGIGVHAYALGYIEAIVQDLHSSAAKKIADIRVVLVAVGLPRAEPADPSGLTHSRTDGDQDPQPSGGRVDARYVDVVDEPEQATVHFSFGHGQTDPDSGKSLLDHYVTVVAPSYELAREAMFASRFGREWSFDYVAGSRQAIEWIPRWIEHERIVLACSAECDALCVPGAPTGEARGWHHDTCPWVPVLEARQRALLDDEDES